MNAIDAILRRLVKEARRDVKAMRERISSQRNRIMDLERELEQAREELTTARNTIAEQEAMLLKTKDAFKLVESTANKLADAQAMIAGLKGNMGRMRQAFLEVWEKAHNPRGKLTMLKLKNAIDRGYRDAFS